MTDRINYVRQTDASAATTWNARSADLRTPPFLAYPEDVLEDPALSIEQKRSILASWLSDVHAVPDAPRWRELENGAFVEVHEIQKALRVLDTEDGRSGGRVGSSSPLGRRKLRKERLGSLIHRRPNDDDDDPPSAPVAAGRPVPPREWDMGAAEELAFAA